MIKASKQQAATLDPRIFPRREEVKVPIGPKQLAIMFEETSFYDVLRACPKLNVLYLESFTAGWKNEVEIKREFKGGSKKIRAYMRGQDRHPMFNDLLLLEMVLEPLRAVYVELLELILCERRWWEKEAKESNGC